MAAHSRRRNKARSNVHRYYYVVGGAAAAVVFIAVALIALTHGVSSTQTTSSAFTSSSGSVDASQSQKPVILYINQGNGAVNQTNFGSMLSFATSQGFNTIFFQVYRSGNLLFSSAQLSGFVSEAHEQGMKIFFALYFTDPSEQMPTALYSLGEDGISLDMSTLPFSSQQALFIALSEAYHGTSAITTTNMSLSLSPDMLILETYGPQYHQFIRPGIIASVGVFATASKADYQQQFQYALENSNGVMVFDYAGLLKSDY